jgi:hypothetical protein
VKGVENIMKIPMSTDIVYEGTNARETVELELEVVNGVLKRISLKNDNIRRGMFYFECIEIPSFYISNKNKTNQIHTIGSNVFRAIGNNSVVIHKDKPINIGNSAFPIKKLVIPESVTAVELGAFSYVLIETVVWPKACETIPDDCFRGSSVMKYEGMENVKSIGHLAFQYNSFEVFDWPKGCREISYGTFISCTFLKELRGIENVTHIGSSAFLRCSGFEKFVWPENCTTIPKSCFKYCSHLAEVIIDNDVIKIEEGAFRDTIIKKLDLSNAMTAEAYEEIEKDIPEIVYPFYN